MILNVSKYVLLLIQIFCAHALLDPISLTIGAGVGLGALTGFSFLKDQTYCRLRECCDERSIPADVNELEQNLKSKLYGQHIVIKQLVPALEAHLSHTKSRKPLVISFHGTPGTGKNYVADIIANTLYAHGLKSKFVHKYFGRADFPLASKTEIYKEKINKDVREGIADCPRSLFIFDEVNQMPPGVFESLTSLVDYSTLDGNDNTQAIFLFLSNTAGVQISNRLGELIKEGMPREDTKLSHFEKTLQLAAYNLDGGLKKASLIEAHVIDHYLPFLPLEKKHVYKCIETEFQRWGTVGKPNVIESIIEDVITYDKNYGLFSTSGCKTIEKKVAVKANQF